MPPKIQAPNRSVSAVTAAVFRGARRGFLHPELLLAVARDEGRREQVTAWARGQGVDEVEELAQAIEGSRERLLLEAFEGLRERALAAEAAARSAEASESQLRRSASRAAAEVRAVYETCFREDVVVAVLE